MTNRSIDLNAYYWGVIIELSSIALISNGYERERFSDINLVHKFWKTTLNQPSTKDLSNTGFINYIEDIQRICSLYLGFYLPNPNEKMKHYELISETPTGVDVDVRFKYNNKIMQAIYKSKSVDVKKREQAINRTIKANI